MKPEDFITAVDCGNPGCRGLAPLTRQYHQMGLVFKVWQCPKCGWTREYSGPPETVVPRNPDATSDVCLIHGRRLSHVADSDAGPIYDCIPCMTGEP